MLSASDLLSRNDFAQAVLSRLTQLGATVLPRYDELSFCFFVDVSSVAATGKSGHLRLEQWYERYKEALLDGRGPLAIDALARYWIQLVQHASEALALDTSRLLPLVRSRFDFVAADLRSAAQRLPNAAAAVEQLAWQPLAEHLVVALAEDSTEAWRYVTKTQLAQSGLSWDAAMDLALKNLRRIEPAFRKTAPFTCSEGSIWVPATRQSPHTAAALLWPELCRALPVAGRHVAFAPFANSLAITGSENYADLSRLATTTISLAKSIADKPLTSIPLILEENQWRPWMPSQAHPLHGVIKELWILHENSVYGEQALLLKQKFEGHDAAPYVASMRVVASTTPNGRRTMGTLSMWTETLPTLLPKSDAVVLTRLLNRGELDANENAEPQFGERITVLWEALASLLGTRLQAQGMYPERFLVSGEDFPIRSAWDKLALSQPEFSSASAMDPADVGMSPDAHRQLPPQSAPATNPGPSSPPAWQAATTAGKVPLAPPAAPSLWPVMLAIAIPIAAVMLLLISVSVFAYWRWSAFRTTIAQQAKSSAPRNPLSQQQRPNLLQQRASLSPPPENIQPPVARPPQFIIKLPWTEIQDYPELGKPEVALPRLKIEKQDVVLSGPQHSRDLDEFRDEAPAEGWLVGMRIVRGFDWGGAIRSLQPIYQVDNEYHMGKLCGSSDGEAQTEVLAKPGYAIGRIECRAGLVNNAVRLTFQRVKEHSLDIDDSYTTQWLGSEGGSIMPAIGGRGEAIVGLSGSFQRNHDIVELQGMVALPLPKVEKPLPRSTGTARSGAATDKRNGSALTDQSPEGGWLVGLRVFQGESWGGAPLAIQPIYQVEDRYVLGKRLGRDGGELHQWIAPPGFAVGEIWADQGLVVHRLQLRYQLVAGAELDPQQSEDSPRLGPEGGTQHCLSSEKKSIVGLTVELGGDISSLGLIVAE